MTDQQAGAVLNAPQDYDDPALVKAAAQALGRKGGQARAKALSAKRLRAIGQQGARARWGAPQNTHN